MNDIFSDERVINNDIIGFTKTQITPPDSICKIMETLNFSNINSNNADNAFLS